MVSHIPAHPTFVIRIFLSRRRVFSLEENAIFTSTIISIIDRSLHASIVFVVFATTLVIHARVCVCVCGTMDDKFGKVMLYRKISLRHNVSTNL